MTQNVKKFRAVVVAGHLLAAFAISAPALASESRDRAAASAAADLQRAFTDAANLAKDSTTLDAAYVLLGIADTAQQQNQPQIAAKAAAAFADLVKRASTAALRAGGSNADDILDQLVDLRFVARTANLPLPQAALDEAMGALFPVVSATLQRNIDNAGRWENKLDYANELAELQASAMQVLLGDMARELNAAFELKILQLENFAKKETDDAEREHMLVGVADAKKNREVLLEDAKANNIESIAEQLKAPESQAPHDAPQRGSVDTSENMELAARGPTLISSP